MKQIVKQNTLKTLIGNNYKCLIGPENPFSLDNPDAFVYKDHTMYAIFIPTYTERENFDHLLRRLYVSQLSIGTMFVPVLLWNEENDIPQYVLRCLSVAFAHISNNIQDVMKFIDGGIKKFWDKLNFSRLQQGHYLNYRLRSDFSIEENVRIQHTDDMNSQYLNDINFEVVTNMESWSEQGKVWHTKKYLRSHLGDFAQCTKSGNNSFETIFQKVMTISFKSMYFFSDGYIEINRNSLPRIRVVDTDWILFSEGFIPNNYHRMLSFVGLTPVKMNSMNEMAYLSDKYYTSYEKVYRKNY